VALLVPNLSGQAQQPAPATPPAAIAQAPTAAAVPGVSVVVLDPGHGGADAGARGPSGVQEKDVVFTLAQVLRSALERQGLRVVVTRQANENPSFDERAAQANAHRGAIFLSLHVSSTGPPGTVRLYYFAAAKPSDGSSAGPSAAEPAVSPGLLRWDQAQEPYAKQSQRLAGLLQVQLAQTFPGSPLVPTAGLVRQLRSVAAPAVAVEISSVSVAERKTLEQMAPGLAEAVTRGVMAFRSRPEGTN